MPLLFGLLALGATLVYYTLYDTYLLALIPSALLLTYLALPRFRWSQTAAFAGVAALAVWSIWWEREYLNRRAALWQAGQLLVQRGVPPEEIDGGYEWNGWYRGQAIFAAAVEQNKSGNMRQLENFVLQNLRRRMRWTLAFEPPSSPAQGSIVDVVPYGGGKRVYAIQRA